MKTSKLLAALLFCFSIVSCTKEKNDNTIYVKTPAELIGSWKWNRTFGGIGLVRYDPISTGKSIVIKLDSLDTYKYFSNDTLKYESKFRIAKTLSLFNHKDSVLNILIDPSPNLKSFSKEWNDLVFNCYISFNSLDTLVFIDPAYDGFDHIYSKIK